ncbi:endopeptidase PepO, partial [Streptococcus pyogenes]
MTTYQDDFYQAVNGKWAETAVIPDDKPRTGGFSDLADEIEALMLDTTDAWLAGENIPDDAILKNFVKFHRLVADYAKRDEVGVSPILPLIEEYQSLKSFSEFVANIAKYELAGLPNEFPFSVAPDFMNAQLNVLWAEAPSILLPDTTYYEEGNEKAEELRGIWRQSQ